MAGKLIVSIVTPERTLFSGSVEEVTVPGVDGQLGILPGHAALISELTAGAVRYTQNGQQTALFCGPGFLEVLPDAVSVLVEYGQAKTEIDVQKARQEQEEANRILRSKEPGTDYQAASRMMKAATAKLEVAQS